MRRREVRDWVCRDCGEYIQRDFGTDDRMLSTALPPIQVDASKCPVCNPEKKISKEDQEKAFRHVKDILDDMFERHFRYERKKHYE